MELGFDAVLLNSAVAQARDPVAMARAFRHAIEAGRLGPASRRDGAAGHGGGYHAGRGQAVRDHDEHARRFPSPGASPARTAAPAQACRRTSSAFEAFGVHGCTAIAAITAQNSVAVERVRAVSAELLDAQLRSAGTRPCRRVPSRPGCSASADNVRCVARWIDRLREHAPVALVVDPVRRATTGAEFGDRGSSRRLPARVAAARHADHAQSRRGRMAAGARSAGGAEVEQRGGAIAKARAAGGGHHRRRQRGHDRMVARLARDAAGAGLAHAAAPGDAPPPRHGLRVRLLALPRRWRSTSARPMPWCSRRCAPRRRCDRAMRRGRAQARCGRVAGSRSTADLLPHLLRATAWRRLLPSRRSADARWACTPSSTARAGSSACLPPACARCNCASSKRLAMCSPARSRAACARPSRRRPSSSSMTIGSSPSSIARMACISGRRICRRSCRATSRPCARPACGWA